MKIIERAKMLEVSLFYPAWENDRMGIATVLCKEMQGGGHCGGVGWQKCGQVVEMGWIDSDLKGAGANLKGPSFANGTYLSPGQLVLQFWKIISFQINAVFFIFYPGNAWFPSWFNINSLSFSWPIMEDIIVLVIITIIHLH